MTASLLISVKTESVQRDPRLTTIFLIGRVSNGARDDLCRIRNISTSGMRIETLAPLNIGQRISVDLKNGVTVYSEVIWAGSAEAGLRFDKPVDVETVLAPAEQSLNLVGARVMRSPRLSVNCLVAVRANGRILPSVMIDISQGGAQVQLSEATEVGDHIVVLIPTLDPRHAAIRWQSGATLGLSFDEKIGFADLSRWLAGPNRFANRPALTVSRIRRSS